MTATTPYFSHDVNAQRDDKCVRLLQTLGWKGYGVYWALIERLHEQKDCALEYNTKGLAWSLHITEKYLIRVLTEFGLFAFSEDGQTFWSNSARRRRAYRSRKEKNEEALDAPKRKRGRPRKNPLPEIKEEVKTISEPKHEKKIEKTDEKKVEKSETKQEHKTAAVIAPSASVEPAELNTLENKKSDARTKPSATKPAEPTSTVNSAPEPPKIPVESIIASWNQIFSGTRQTYKGLMLDSISYQRAKESFSLGYTFEHIEEAFRIARGDSFSWLLKDVLKPDNIQRLLIKGDKANAGKLSGSVLGNISGTTQPLPDDDWGNPDKWSRFELQQK